MSAPAGLELLAFAVVTLHQASRRELIGPDKQYQVNTDDLRRNAETNAKALNHMVNKLGLGAMEVKNTKGHWE